MKQVKITVGLIIPVMFWVIYMLPAHTSGASSEWTFAAMSDSQMGNRTFARILEAIKNDPLRPELITHSGDMIATRGSRAEWNTFYKMLNILDGRIPVYSAVGNHDVNGPISHRTYLEKVRPPGGKTHYSFEHKNALFIALDTNMPGELRRIGAWQRKWLAHTLENRDPKKHRWTFVFFHIPIFPQGLYRKMKQPLIEGEKTHEILRDHRVTAVFMGHEHMYNHTEKDNVHYFITGGAGGRLYKGWGGEFHHWIRVTVSDRKIVTQAIDLSGKVRDTQTIR